MPAPSSLPDTLDRLLVAADTAMRTVFAPHRASRPCPKPANEAPPLDDAARREAAALMRVNHVGEVCAQALYAAQSITARRPEIRAQMEHAAREETDHLAWCEERLQELGGRTSLLNPLWYAGAFGIGLIAGRAGDRWSLGFVVETERQVEQHLDSHLERLPAGDVASRAIVRQMRDDEVAHAMAAERAGGAPLPNPVRWVMQAAAKVMTTTAHRI